MKIEIDEYQKKAFEFASKDAKANPLLNGVLGLFGEGGEISDLLKKHMFQGHDLNKDDLVLELGDVLWYVAEIATSLNVDLSEVAQKNLDKLKRRYPNGFKKEDSINRHE